VACEKERVYGLQGNRAASVHKLMRLDRDEPQFSLFVLVFAMVMFAMRGIRKIRKP